MSLNAVTESAFCCNDRAIKTIPIDRRVGTAGKSDFPRQSLVVSPAGCNGPGAAVSSYMKMLPGECVSPGASLSRNQAQSTEKGRRFQR
ncbi:MAG: hypothetical protein AB1482_10540 [Pseudomonadota bacterium]